MKFTFILFSLLILLSPLMAGNENSHQVNYSAEMHYQSVCADDCPWDFDDDGFVNAGDILPVFAIYGLETVEGCEVGDFDESGLVTVDDMRDFLPHWTTICD